MAKKNTTPAKKTIKKSKCKTFPMLLCEGNPMPTFEEWYGKEIDEDSEEYDENIGHYEEEFAEFTYYTKDDSFKVVFNLGEWCDPCEFEPEEECDVKPFHKIDRKSYTVSLKCDTWDQDCHSIDYVGDGTFYLLADSGFYDDLEQISNGYVKGCILHAFKIFLESVIQEMGEVCNGENETWIGDWM